VSGQNVQELLLPVTLGNDDDKLLSDNSTQRSKSTVNSDKDNVLPGEKAEPVNLALSILDLDNVGADDAKEGKAQAVAAPCAPPDDSDRHESGKEAAL